MRKAGTLQFRVVLHKSRYGYDVYCPALPGCASQGETEAEALVNIEDAIRSWLKAQEVLARRKARERGLSVREVQVAA